MERCIRRSLANLILSGAREPPNTHVYPVGDIRTPIERRAHSYS